VPPTSKVVSTTPRATPTSTSWLSRIDFAPSDYLHANDLNSLGLDIRNWGGDVNAGGYRLTNVVFDGSGSFQYYTSPVEITPGTDSQSITQYAAAGSPNPVVRWSAGKDATAESGSNAGSNYAISRYSDTGVLIDKPLSIDRASGVISLGQQLWTAPINGNGQTLNNVVIPGVLTDPTSAKGEMLARGATALMKVPVGVDGYALFADSSQPMGVRWAPNTGAVSSVFGRTGAVVATAGDYTAAQITNAISSALSYADPAWITSLAWSKIAGAPSFALSATHVFAGAGMSGGGPISADVTLNANVTTVFGRTGDVVLTSGDLAGAGGVPSTRQVIAGAGMTGGGALSADVTLNAAVTSVFGRTGAVTLTSTDITTAGGVPTTRTLTAGTGLTGGGDLSANRSFAVVDDTTTQKIRASQNGTFAANRREINFIAGSNISISVSDIAANNRMDVSISASGGVSPGPIDPTTTLGDMIVRSSTALSRLPVGTDGQVVTADSTQPLGVRWAVPTTGMSQSPWVSDIDAAGHSLGNVGSITASGLIKSTSGGIGFPDATIQMTAGVLPSRQVIAGSGMTGGGALTADVTLNAAVISVFGRTGTVTLTSADITAAGGVPSTRQVLAGSGMTGGGALTADVTLSANVTSVFGRTGAVVLTTGDITGAGGMVDPTTTKGDLISRSSSAVSRLPISATDGQVLTVDSTQTLGMKWATPAAQPQTPWTVDHDAAGYRLINTGNVGLGTSSPTARLTVSTNAATLPGPPSGTVVHVGAIDSGTPRIVLDGFGGIPTFAARMALGTAASPSAVTSGLTLGIFGALGRGSATYATSSRGHMSVFAAENWSDSVQGTYLTFSTTAATTLTTTEKMRITDAGNVGIGTSIAPTGFPQTGTSYLTVKGSTTFGALEMMTGEADADGSVIGALTFTDPVNNQTDKRLALIVGSRSGSAANNRGSVLSFHTRADGTAAVSERMRISNTGLVGINNNGPGRLLHVLGSGTASTANQITMQGYRAAFELMNAAANQNYYFGIDDADASKLKIGIGYSVNQGLIPTITMTPGQPGNVGIGVSPSYRLDISGDVNITGTYRVNGAALATGGGAISFANSRNRATSGYGGDGTGNWDAAFQNVTGKWLWLAISASMTNNGSLKLLVGAGSAPDANTDLVSWFTAPTAYGITVSLFAWVPPNYYYRLLQGNGGSVFSWREFW